MQQIINQGKNKNILARNFAKINKLCSTFIRETRVVTYMQYAKYLEGH